MLLWSLRVNIAVFGVFLALQVTEILLVIGFFRVGPRHEPVVPARRGLGRDRDCRDRVVRVGRGRDQRHVVLAGIAGRAAALGPAALAHARGFSHAEAPGGLGWRA
jgi:hypothetical protein